MTENTMPVTEVEELTDTPERVSYELAFHILPTVTEGEVPEIVADLKTLITAVGGEVIDEETPAHFTLAYEIEKYLEGRYRKFTSAYFGWIRFTLKPDQINGLVAEVEGHKRLLRHLCIRLTKAEEANSFRFHEALASDQVETIDTDVEAPKADASDDLEKGETDMSEPASDNEADTTTDVK